MSPRLREQAGRQTELTADCGSLKILCLIFFECRGTTTIRMSILTRLSFQASSFCLGSLRSRPKRISYLSNESIHEALESCREDKFGSSKMMRRKECLTTQ